MTAPITASAVGNIRGHGRLDLTGAFAQSCNVAFMKMAEECGINSLTAMAVASGWDKPPAWGFCRKKKGWCRRRFWAQVHFHRRWEFGETLQVGIGQSALEITPLQGARVIAAIANGGKLVTPRLVARVGDATQPLHEPASLGLSTETLQRITTGLQAVVGEGTAHNLDPSLHIAGKTGTAQNPHGEDHAWFVGFAPLDAPQIAVAVVVEQGGHGGAIAVPIAEKVIRAALQH